MRARRAGRRSGGGRIAWGSVLCAVALVLTSSARAQTPGSPGADLPVFRELERIAVDVTRSRTDRLSAIGSLAKAAHPSVTPVLLTLLQDADPEVRSAGAVALGWAGNRAATAALIQRAGDTAEAEKVRVSALRALGRIGDPAAVPAAERLAREPGVPIRREALLALIDSPLSAHADRVSAAITLVQDLELDGHVRSRAASLLGSAKDSRAVEPLLRVLQDPRPPAGFAELPSPDGLTGQTKVMAERLRSLHSVRAHAAMALGRLQDQRAGPALLAVLADGDPLVRMQSAAALGHLKPAGALGGLVAVVDDPDPRVRELAVRALGALCDPAAGPALRRATQDPEVGVRGRAAIALGLLAYEAARPELLKLAEEDEAAPVRERARAALRRVDSGQRCQSLGGGLRPPSEPPPPGSGCAGGAGARKREIRPWSSRCLLILAIANDCGGFAGTRRGLDRSGRRPSVRAIQVEVWFRGEATGGWLGRFGSGSLPRPGRGSPRIVRVASD
jgi:HEAT repeat protein